MRAKRGLGISLAIALVAGLVSGCGGGDEDTVTKAEFVRNANAICKRAEEVKNSQLTSTFKVVSKEQEIDPTKELSLLFEAAVPPIRQMAEELADLAAPEGEEVQIEAIVKGFQQEIGAIEANPQSAAEGEVGFFRKANRLSKKYGLDECAQI